MTTPRNDLKAGSFIVIAAALAIGVIVWIRGASVGPMQVRAAAFHLEDDLGGLRVGDEVRLGGFKVGVVRGVEPIGLGTADAKLIVHFALPGSYTMHKNAVVGVQTGLTGVTNLNIATLGTGDALSDGETLDGQADPKTALFASLGKMSPELEKTIPKVNQAVDTAKTLLAHADTKVDPVVERYNQVATNAGAAMGQVNDLLGDTKPDIRGTMKNLNSATGTIKDKLPGLVDRLTAVITKVEGSLTTAQSALVDIQQTAANAKDLTGSLRGVIVDNHGKFEGMITSLKTTSDNLKEASIEIRHSPWRLLYKPTPEESANLNLYDSAREFSDGAESLSDAARTLRDTLKDPKADEAQIRQRVTALDQSFTHFHDVENKLLMTAKH